LIDQQLVQFARPEELAFLRAFDEHGNFRQAARALGVHHSTVSRGIERLKVRAAAQGYSPDHGLTRVVPMPFIARGHSTLDKIHGGPIDENGRQQVLQWTKTRLTDVEWLDRVKDGISAFALDTIKPLKVAMPDRCTDIVPWINIGDAHFGMLAHEAETGENFDLKIAERELCAAMDIVIDEMVFHDRVVVQDMGDFTHYENMSATTEASGHALDFDGRFPKMIKVYSRVMRYIIDKVLTKANTVDVIINQGNHSRTNDIWMAELLRVAYGHTGRVNVLNNDSVFIGYRMGNTFVLCHHSDKCKPTKLAHVMATDYRIDWGETEYHYIDIGHIHHNMVSKEHPGVTIESFNQLAAKDKYAAEGGWRSRQSLTIVHRSRTYGDVGRKVLPIRRVRDVIAARMAAEGRPYRMPQPLRAFAA
jgi:hypothetical protein